MPADARQWLEFASADLRAAQILLSDADMPSRIACFHAQQAAILEAVARWLTSIV